MRNDRDKSLDILKSWGIFLMIFDHVGWGDSVHAYIQSFHMPLFFLVSGYLWKYGQPLSYVATHRFKTSMIPYISFSTGYLVLLVILVKLGLMTKSVPLAVRAVLLFPTDMDNMPFAPALWFLPCFYLCNVVFAFLDKTFGDKKWVFIVCIAIAGMVFSSLTNIMLPLCIEPLSTSLLFMLIGSEAKKHEGKNYKWFDYWWVILIVIAVEFCISYLNGACDLRSARYHNCILYLLNAVMGTLGWWLFARKVKALFSARIIKRVSYLSINSVLFLCMNQFIIIVCRSFFNRFGIGEIPTPLLINLGVLIITLVACYIINEILIKLRLTVILGR